MIVAGAVAPGVVGIDRLGLPVTLPYVAWTAFATFLSATIVRLNR
jgi:tryptophan-rich sensory protein